MSTHRIPTASRPQQRKQRARKDTLTFLIVELTDEPVVVGDDHMRDTFQGHVNMVRRLEDAIGERLRCAFEDPETKVGRVLFTGETSGRVFHFEQVMAL